MPVSASALETHLPLGLRPQQAIARTRHALLNWQS
jgi:hypothetical protein